MIPAAFEYHRPETLAEASGLLVQLGDEARVLAGGHSLIPMMKLRLTDLSHLVDLQDIPGLSDIEIDGGTIRIGAMVTQNELIENQDLANAAPILREAALQIADPQVRYVGTVGGNVANGDPGNDLPGLMQCLNASYELTGPNGSRQVPARAFYESAYITARKDDEILSQIVFPAPGAGAGHAYEKLKRKIGDYATAAAAVMLRIEAGTCVEASIAMTNLADTPVWAEAAGAALVGSSLDETALNAAVSAALDVIDPVDDNRGPVEFKIHVAGVIIRRAIERAAKRATERTV